MSQPFVVEAKCLVLIHAEDADSAADQAQAELENIGFDIEIISSTPW